VARREWMGARQPGMEGHDPGLGAEADHRRDGDQRLDRRPGGLRGGWIADAADAGQRQQRDPDSGPAEMRDREVLEHRRARRTFLAGHEDRRRRQQRHELPEEKEGDRAARGEYTGERQHERGAEDAKRRAVWSVAQGSARMDQRGAGAGGQGEQEEAGEGVEAEVEAGAVAEARPRCGRSEQKEESACAEAEHAESLHHIAHAARAA